MKDVLKIWWIALAVKIALAIWLPLANDEAYYWVWGHHPQLSYFDHPAMVGWLFWAGQLFENFGNAARLPGVLLAHSTLLIWSAILSPFLLTLRLKKGWLIFLGLSPFLGLGSLILTPDTPFLFFWSLSLLFLLRAFSKQAWSDYAGLGIALGLGFCSKYLIVLFVPCIFIWITIDRLLTQVQWRKVALTLFLGLLFCAPVLIWNSQNEWASFKFQLSHGLEAYRRNPLWPLEYLAGQLGILFPIAVAFALLKKSQKGTSFLHVFGWFPIAFFFYTSFRARVEGNWPAMSHPAILALAFLNAQSFATGARWIKVQSAVWIVASLIVLSQVAAPWIPLDPKKLKTSEFTKFAALIPAAREHAPHFYAGSYQMAGALSYDLRQQIYKLEGMNRRDFYDFVPDSRPRGDRFFVGSEIGQPLPDWVAASGFVIINERNISDSLRLLEVSKGAKDISR